MITTFNRITVWLMLTLAVLGCDQPVPPSNAQARFTRQTEWIGKGQWLKADTHIHTKFSDGAHTVLEIVAQANSFGCDAIAITDHADHDLDAASEEYIQAIKTARHAYPNMIIVAGLEWNIPPWDGREHVTVLIPSSFKDGDLLRQFKLRFDDVGKDQHDPALADEALRWLAQYGSVDGVAPVMIYNHPSRKQLSSRDIIDPFTRWRNTNDIAIGFSGAPGHQKQNPIGAYLKTETTIDRWDPAAARIGDAWDDLLAAGVDVWAARAPSDFHRTHNDAWPGQFSETWLYAPDRSPQGVLRALRAGSFFAAHGHIVREVVFTVDAAGLARPAWAGEIIEVLPQTTITVRMDMQVPDHDWDGHTNRIDALELIAISSTSGNAKIIATKRPNRENPVFTKTFEALPGGMVLRARGRRVVDAGPDLMFYTNPIRIRVSDSLTQEN